MQQQQNTNKHVSGRKHAGRRRGKHGEQGGGDSRHSARVWEPRQVRLVALIDSLPNSAKSHGQER